MFHNVSFESKGSHFPPVSPLYLRRTGRNSIHTTRTKACERSGGNRPGLGSSRFCRVIKLSDDIPLCVNDEDPPYLPCWRPHVVSCATEAIHNVHAQSESKFLESEDGWK